MKEKVNREVEKTQQNYSVSYIFLDGKKIAENSFVNEKLSEEQMQIIIKAVQQIIKN